MVATSGKVVETRKVAKRKAWALLHPASTRTSRNVAGITLFVTTDTPTGNTMMILCADAHRGSQLIKQHNRCDETPFPCPHAATTASPALRAETSMSPGVRGQGNLRTGAVHMALMMSRECGPGGLKCHCCSPTSLARTNGAARAKEKSAWRREMRNDEHSEQLEANLHDFADDSDWALLIGT